MPKALHELVAKQTATEGQTNNQSIERKKMSIFFVLLVICMFLGDLKQLKVPTINYTEWGSKQ